MDALKCYTTALIWSQRDRSTTSYKHYTHCVLRQRDPL